MGFRLRLAIVCGIAAGFLFYAAFISPPFSFPQKLLLPVRAGENGNDIAAALKIDHAIRSELLFRVLLRLYGADTHIIAGTYYFPNPQNAFSIAWRFKIGNFQLEPVRVTIPEGTNTHEMNTLLLDALPTFDSATFLTLTQGKEGYLFPDTYFFYPGESMTEIVRTLQDNFNARIADSNVQDALHASKYPLSDIIIMASLLEKEAPDTKNRQIISGILWKRLSMDMPLQVDAVFPFITGKDGKDITQADYAIESPYNTYLHKGLPPGPITNPGLDAILAAATPTTTPYLYYLSDKQGNFHYSATYDGQLENQKKYR